MATHPSVGRVTKVRHLMDNQGGWAHYDSDLIFLQGRPFVVLEWEPQPGGDLPKVKIPLDPAKLHKIGWSQAEYMYQDALQDPRGPQQIPDPP
jgi:hypothetical protein